MAPSPRPPPRKSQSSPEFVAVILAATTGARLFPLTSDPESLIIEETTGNFDSLTLEDANEKEDGKDRGEGMTDEQDKRTKRKADGRKEEGTDTGRSRYHVPKHLLPVGGTPVLLRLLRHLASISGFTSTIVTIASSDNVTADCILNAQDCIRLPNSGEEEKNDNDAEEVVVVQMGNMQITVVKLRDDEGQEEDEDDEGQEEECGGSADALRYISSTNRTKKSVLPTNSHVVVLPGDLILDSDVNTEDPLKSLVDAHRRKYLDSTMIDGDPDDIDDDAQGGDGGEGYSSTTARNGRKRVGRKQTSPPPACTMLLSDVGEEDESGIPLKESAKAKKGGLAREEEEIEYICLSSPINSPTLASHNNFGWGNPSAASAAHHNENMIFSSSSTSSSSSSHHQQQQPYRVLLKQSKIAVEEDEDITGTTPKLILPKKRFHSSGLSLSSSSSRIIVRTDLSDLHVYALSPWIIRLLHARRGLLSLQKEVVPVLISRQFRGVSGAFGSKALQDSTNQEILDDILSRPPFAMGRTTKLGYDGIGDEVDNSTAATSPRVLGSGDGRGRSDDAQVDGGTPSLSTRGRNYPFAVSALILPRERLALRACTVPSYLYGCREAVTRAIHPPSLGQDEIKGENSGGKKAKPSASSSVVPPSSYPDGTEVQPKFNSLLLPNASVGEKVTIKSSTIGRRSKLGDRCRLNNVIVMDDVTVGSNCVLQNSVLGTGSTLGDNCNLNDCQVGPGAVVPSGTKEKGESFMR